MSKFPMIPECPNTPNCLSSFDNKKSKNYVEPIAVKGQDFDLMKLSQLILQNSSAKLTVQTENHLHFEFTSKFFKFIDDVDLVFDNKSKLLHIRSASRTGYYDFGANRKRVNWIKNLVPHTE